MKRLTAASLAVFTFCGLFAATASGAFIVHLIDKEIIYLVPPVRYPTAEKTQDPSVVISPYYPHNLPKEAGADRSVSAQWLASDSGLDRRAQRQIFNRRSRRSQREDTLPVMTPWYDPTANPF